MDQEKDVKIVLGVFETPPHPYHLEWIDDTWIYTDINPRSADIKKVDARSIPWENLAAIYASHTVEHIAQHEVLPMLQNWFESLKPGGTIHINVPDMQWVGDHMHEMDKKRLEEIVFGGRDTEYDWHKSWYTKQYLEELLQIIGYKNVIVEQVYEAHDMQCLIATASK